MLDYRKRLLGGAVITVVGLGTALLFRKPPEEVRPVVWPSGFTEVQPSTPLVDPTPPEPVQPRLAGRIEALAEGTPGFSPTPSSGSLYQMPGSSNAPVSSEATATTPSDPFLRGGSAFGLPAASSPALNLSANDNQQGAAQATANPGQESPSTPVTVYKLEELKPLVPTDQATSPAPATFAEPAKLDPAQQAAASSLAASVEQPGTPTWSPNRSSGNSAVPNDQLSLAERPSLLAPPPLSGLPNPAPATSYKLPNSETAPSLSLPSTGFAPAPLLTSSSALPSSPAASGMKHRIVDGDTLGTIAKLYYGDEQRARELFEANRQVLRDPELLPIGTELVIPGGSASQSVPPASPMPGAPMSQAVPPLLTPPALEQFGPRTLAVSNSNGRGGNQFGVHEAASMSAAPPTPVALSPWDQQLANAAPLQQPASMNTLPTAQPLVNPAPAPAGWPPVSSAPVPSNGPLPGNGPVAPQVGWPPQPSTTPAGWPTRTWNSTESALNWVGDKLMGAGAPSAPSASSKTYLVKPLETWETLAQRFYGDARYATVLQNANLQIPAGSKIRPGSVINVPTMPL